MKRLGEAYPRWERCEGSLAQYYDFEIIVRRKVKKKGRYIDIKLGKIKKIKVIAQRQPEG